MQNQEEKKRSNKRKTRSEQNDADLFIEQYVFLQSITPVEEQADVYRKIHSPLRINNEQALNRVNYEIAQQESKRHRTPKKRRIEEKPVAPIVEEEEEEQIVVDDVPPQQVEEVELPFVPLPLFLFDELQPLDNQHEVDDFLRMERLQEQQQLVSEEDDEEEESAQEQEAISDEMPSVFDEENDSISEEIVYMNEPAPQVDAGQPMEIVAVNEAEEAAGDSTAEDLPYWEAVDDELAMRKDPLVGRRIEVFWPGERQWFAGLVFASDDARKGTHMLLYDDTRAEARLRKKRPEMFYQWLHGEQPEEWDDPTSERPDSYRKLVV